MNKQLKRDKEYSLKLSEGYTHNLGLLLGALKNELQDINKDKVIQFNNLKTIMWLNIIFVGISIKTIEYNPNLYLYIFFALVSGFAILFSLIGMIQGKHTAYTSIGRPSIFTKIANDEWAKAQGFLTVIYSYRRAIKYNGINLIKRAKWLRASKLTTIASFFLLIILISCTIIYNKGEKLAKSKPPVTPIGKNI